jgi:hypothetical protein
MVCNIHKLFWGSEGTEEDERCLEPVPADTVAFA